MRRYLVVANRTLGGAHLREHLQRCLADAPGTVHVVVPASHDSGMTWTEGEAHAVATRRLTTALEQMKAMGIEATGEVGDASPVSSVGDALLQHAYDEIIVSTLPPGPSRWLKQDAVHRIQRTVDIPVTHLVAEPVGAARG